MKVKCKGRTFEVYTPHEATELGIKFRTDWRNAEKDDWILTYDQMVVQVISRSEKKPKRAKKSVVSIGTGYGRTPTTFGRIYAKPLPSYENKGVRNLRPTALQKVFVEDLATHGEIAPNGTFTPQSIIESHQSVYQENNDNKSLVRGRNIIKKEWAEKLMSKIMKEKFDKLEMDDDKVAQMYVDFVEDKDFPPLVRKQVLDRISKLRGHDDVETKDIKEDSQEFLIAHGDVKALMSVRKLIALVQNKFASGEPIDADFIDEMNQIAGGVEIKQIEGKDDS